MKGVRITRRLWWATPSVAVERWRTRRVVHTGMRRRWSVRTVARPETINPWAWRAVAARGRGNGEPSLDIHVVELFGIATKHFDVSTERDREGKW